MIVGVCLLIWWPDLAEANFIPEKIMAPTKIVNTYNIIM